MEGVMINPENSIRSLSKSLNTENPPRYGKCLHKVEKNMKALKTTQVSREARMELSESLRKASDKKTEKNIWREELKSYLKSGNEIPSSMMNAINSLDEKGFHEFIYSFLSERAVNGLEGSKKLEVIHQLTDEKQAAFKNFLGQGNRYNPGYIPTYGILQGASKEEMETFISGSPLIQKFVSNPGPFMFAWSAKKSDPEFNEFAKLVVLNGVKEVLRENPSRAKGFIASLLNDREFGAEIREALKESLTPEERNRLE